MTPNEDTRFWDRLSDSYSKRPFPDPAATARKLAVTRSLLRPDSRVLDIGCGTGTIPLELAPHCAHVLGVDLSPAMIALAEDKARAQGATNASFEARPAGTLAGMPDAAFDCVCAYNVLHLVEDPAALLQAMHRVLAPGGALVTSTPCLGGVFPPFWLILPVMTAVGKAPGVTRFTHDALRAMVRDAGFAELDEPDVGTDARNVFLVARKPA